MSDNKYFSGARFIIKNKVQILSHMESSTDPTDPMWICEDGSAYSVSYLDEAAKPYNSRIVTVPQIYSHDRWNAMIESTFEEVRHLAKAKGGEYSGDTDRLLNFRRNAEALGVPKELIWAVYSAKHWDAIMQYVRDLVDNKKRERLESIDGRIRDLIVYLLLLQAMVDERAGA